MRKTFANKRLFEMDRKVELKLRLAAKKAGGRVAPEPPSLVISRQPTAHDIRRLIDCMREL
ncbi:MAG: hypothetical protein GTO18_10980 [Anaerolineales bacterium]|nr:hypothetical protein [Anaerolineales bacterium]